jgi:ribA/ribD-fused uncharacterized protein
MSRCPNGSRKNRKTGECVEVGTGRVVRNKPSLAVTDIPHKTRQTRCEKGTRRNRKTGLCVPNKAKSPTPKSKSPTPKAKSPTPKSKSPTPKSKSPTPKAKSPTPSSSGKPPMTYMIFYSKSALLKPNKVTKKRLFDLPEDAMRRLSNFSSDEVEYKGHRYPTIEHAYQAHKYNYTSKPELMADFYIGGKIKTAEDAQKAGRKSAMTASGTALDLKRWEPTADKVMEDLVKYKVQNYPEIRNILSIMRKNNVYLVHYSMRDKIWGATMNTDRTAIKSGQNKLGKIYNTIAL